MTDKTKPIYGLEKIDDSQLLKFSRREVGELKSEIDYLKDIIKTKDKEIKELTFKLEIRNEDDEANYKNMKLMYQQLRKKKGL